MCWRANSPWTPRLTEVTIVGDNDPQFPADEGIMSSLGPIAHKLSGMARTLLAI